MVVVAIDCDAQPLLREGWTVEDHRKGGQVVFDLHKVEFYTSPRQMGKGIEGNKLRKELKGKPVMNACVLDHLLANPTLIPESWKMDGAGNPRCIYFWGTIFRGKIIFVRYLWWRDGEWAAGTDWLASKLDTQRQAAVFSG
jgi:hypothetical protein